MSATDRRRRRLVQGALAAAALPAVQPSQAQAAEVPQRKVLRLLFSSAETSFDPARISDLYSRAVTMHIFEAPYCYDPLARPARLRPLTAIDMPEVSNDFRVWTVRIKPGIFFAADPAFKGKKRELVAQDYVYAFQRAIDPANISPIEASTLDLKIKGLLAARDAAKARKRFDYDAPIEGLRALDRYTLRFELEEPRPRFIDTLAISDLLGGIAREVVEFYGDAIGDHPVGTGPFRLKSWRRSSRIVMERNPDYREVLYDAMPGPEDAEGQEILAKLQGKRLPIIDEVDIAIIEEFQPEWLSFLNKQVDALATSTGHLPSQYANEAAPGGKLAPRLARQGIRMYANLAPDNAFTYFNMRDPVVGGYSAQQVALRRAISLSYDVDQEIRLIRRGRAVPGQSVLMPHTTGYDPHFKSEMSDYDPARARALLDLYGFVDRDGDGFRERPDGSPLLLEMATEPEQIYRAYNELWQKCLNAIGVRVRFNTAQWPENMKAADAGKLMMWMLGESASGPDGQDSLGRLYGPLAGNANLARFQLDAFDRLYERAQVLPDGPERAALFREAQRISIAYMPYKIHAHRIHTDLAHPWVFGFRRPLFSSQWWHTVDVDMALRAQRLSA
ncbi:MAG TPA: ABC transporter substrate-binding protein [Burkholderiaceae bacterium]|nr:ABC transporter substrate-binding protein [Burkholderiaceae bacterium]